MPIDYDNINDDEFNKWLKKVEADIKKDFDVEPKASSKKSPSKFDLLYKILFKEVDNAEHYNLFMDLLEDHVSKWGEVIFMTTTESGENELIKLFNKHIHFTQKNNGIERAMISKPLYDSLLIMLIMKYRIVVYDKLKKPKPAERLLESIFNTLFHDPYFPLPTGATMFVPISIDDLINEEKPLTENENIIRENKIVFYPNVTKIVATTSRNIYNELLYKKISFKRLITKFYDAARPKSTFPYRPEFIFNELYLPFGAVFMNIVNGTLPDEIVKEISQNIDLFCHILSEEIYDLIGDQIKFYNRKTNLEPISKEITVANIVYPPRSTEAVYFVLND